jgi:hypothetical protein
MYLTSVSFPFLGQQSSLNIAKFSMSVRVVSQILDKLTDFH